jgi:hypothetical protein
LNEKAEFMTVIRRKNRLGKGNWKCRLFGHKLKDISGDSAPGPDGTMLSIRNMGICEREGTVHVLNRKKRWWWKR